MSEFLKPRDSKAFEEALNAAHTASELREAVIQSLQREGQIVPTEDAGFNYRLQPDQTSAPDQSLPVARPADDSKCFRVIYPSGNSRFEIYGATESDLDAQETRIRQMYGSR